MILELFCRNCSHMTYATSEGLCLWCGSANISAQPETVKHRRCMGPITEPEDRTPTKHQNLKTGFALLHAAESGG